MLLPAQTAHKKASCPSVEEVIPANAVEPEHESGKAYCPRDDFKLEWFVVKEEEYATVVPSGYITWGCGNGICGANSVPKSVLRFKAVCLPKEQP
jgi:hypothetical protein